MALTDKLTAIANAIRAKTGGSDLLTLDEIPQEIASIETGGGGGTSEEIDDIVLTDLSNKPVVTEYSTNNVEKKYIRQYAFYNCGNLENVDAPNIENIGTQAFVYCAKLTSVKFPNITVVNTSAFQDSGVERADFTNSYTQVPIILQTSCFRRSNLETLIIRNVNTVATLGSTSVFQSTPIASGTGYIYVPQSLLEQYKVATNWVTYANQFRAIEDYPEICGSDAQ